jgi:hypothetical protein
VIDVAIVAPAGLTQWSSLPSGRQKALISLRAGGDGRW